MVYSRNMAQNFHQGDNLRQLNIYHEFEVQKHFLRKLWHSLEGSWWELGSPTLFYSWVWLEIWPKFASMVEVKIVMGDKVEISHRLDSMILEIFSQPKWFWDQKLRFSSSKPRQKMLKKLKKVLWTVNEVQIQLKYLGLTILERSPLSIKPWQILNLFLSKPWLLENIH